MIYALLICVQLANRKCRNMTGIISPCRNFNFSKFAASYSTVLTTIVVIWFPVPPVPENIQNQNVLFISHTELLLENKNCTVSIYPVVSAVPSTQFHVPSLAVSVRPIQASIPLNCLLMSSCNCDSMICKE